MFDLVCILIIIGAVYLGGRRGFMAQIGAFVGIIVGIIVCRVFGSQLAGAFTSPTDTVGTRLLHSVLAYVVLFGFCYLGGRIVGNFLHGTIKILHLGLVDRIGGAILKLVEYLLVFSILLNLWIAVFPDTSLTSRRAGLTEFVIGFAPVVLDSEVASDVVRSSERLDDRLRDAKDREAETDSVKSETEPTSPAKRLNSSKEKARKGAQAVRAVRDLNNAVR